MSERYGFSTSWREIPADRVQRDLAVPYWFKSYDQAHDQHRRACQGRWVTEVMVDPQVGDLIGVDGGRHRTISRGVDLWRDDRPKMTREEFAVLWREWKALPDRRAAA